jgi:hypothetical protein
MAEDPKISQRYRELSREEPPRHVDEAILAAARRAAETRPAPLVVPSGRRRWYFPLAAAAIIVLAVAVTVQVERQQPDPEAAVAPVTARKTPTDEQTEPAAKPAPARKPAPPQVFVPDPKQEPARAESAGAAVPPPARPPSPQADRKEPSAPAATPPPGLMAQRDMSREAEAQRRLDEALRSQAKAPPSPSPAPQAASESRMRSEIQRAPAPAAARPMAKPAVEPPEQWLERIGELRKQGKHDEADKALAEFRRTYPDYRISEAMLEKVEKK